MPFALLQFTIAVPEAASEAIRPYAGLIFGFVFLLIAGWLTFAIVRSRARRKYQTDVAYQNTVLLITVPKESSEKGESGLREKSLQEVVEDIGVMENIFASLGGLKAERGMTAWFLGRQDAI